MVELKWPIQLFVFRCRELALVAYGNVIVIYYSISTIPYSSGHSLSRCGCDNSSKVSSRHHSVTAINST